MRTAVLGAGLAGLAAAYELASAGRETLATHLGNPGAGPDIDSL